MFFQSGVVGSGVVGSGVGASVGASVGFAVVVVTAEVKYR